MSVHSTFQVGSDIHEAIRSTQSDSNTVSVRSSILTDCEDDIYNDHKNYYEVHNSWAKGQYCSIRESPLHEKWIIGKVVAMDGNTPLVRYNGTQIVNGFAHEIKPNVKEIRFRQKWTVGSECQIYSRKKKEWCDGKIVDVYTRQKSGEEWMKVSYDKRWKWIQRMCQDIRPIDLQTENHENKYSFRFSTLHILDLMKSITNN